MSNPILVEVTRGNVIESRHRGAIAVVDADGTLRFSCGDIEAAVFPRSAVKAIQALPLVESGAADRLGFGDRELALACASHSGEPDHAHLAASMLERAGFAEPDLECGTHWPFAEKAMRQMAAEGGLPSQLHNNCSGKHAGFLCTCGQLGFEPRGYVEPDHPLQREIAAAMEAVTRARHDAGQRAIDGCSIPTYAVPIRSLALGFARLATGAGLAPMRAEAGRRLLSACMAEHWLVAGTDKADTALMRAAPGRIFAKTGAEGVYCAAVPELGLGIALKCDDGAARAAETMVAAMLSRLLAHDADLAQRLDALARPPIVTRRGAVVGATLPAGPLLEAV